MKNRPYPVLLFLAAATTFAGAATTNKLDNGTALDQAGSWDNGVPTSVDTAKWTGSVSTTASIGGNGSNTTGITVGGIVADSSGNNTISANGQSTLTLNGTVSVSNGTFTVDSRVYLGASGTRIFNVESAMNMTTSNVVGGAIINKQGTGTLTITNGAYTAGLTITAGTLSTGLITNSNSISGLGNTDGTASRLQFAGGTLRYTGAATSTDRAFRILAGNGTFEASGTGALNWGTGTKAMDYGASFTNAARTLTLSGTNTGNNTMGTKLIDNGTGKLSLSKSGSGTWVLSNNNTYSGNTTVVGGTLRASSAGALGNSTVINLNSGTLLVTAANAVNDTAAINLGGGSLAMSGTFDESVGTLTLSANSTIDLAGFTGTLRFAGVGAWTGESNLAIWNWNGINQYGTPVGDGLNNRHVVFTDGSGLGSYLDRISFYSDSGSSFVGNAFEVGFSGGGTEIIAVPEVSAFSTPLLCLAGLGLHRLFQFCQRNRRRSAF